MKSVASFIRRTLKIKGNSVHTGRGSVFMFSNEPVNLADTRAKLEELLPKWEEKGYITSSEFNDKKIVIEFNDKLFDEHYHTFVVYADNPSYKLGQVNFSISERAMARAMKMYADI